MQALNRQRGKGKVKMIRVIVSFVEPEKLDNIPALEWGKHTRLVLQSLSCKTKGRSITCQSYFRVVCLSINLTLTCICCRKKLC